jgi:hypothetical protein
MKKTLSPRNAKKRVIDLCWVLLGANPKQADIAIQNAAIDLHDIEMACLEGCIAISALRRHDPKDKDKTREMLIGLDIKIIDEIVRHASSLIKFFRETGIRDNISKRKAKKK